MTMASTTWMWSYCMHLTKSSYLVQSLQEMCALYIMQVTRLFITRGTELKLTGTLIYFIKTKRDTVLTDFNICNDVTMGIIDAGDSEGLLSVLERYMHSCVYPPITAIRDWGLMLKEPSGMAVHGNFLGM